MIVDGLPRNTGLGSDQVDIGAAETLAAEHVGGSIDDRLALCGVGPQGLVELGLQNLSSKKKIMLLDELDKCV